MPGPQSMSKRRVTRKAAKAMPMKKMPKKMPKMRKGYS